MSPSEEKEPVKSSQEAAPTPENSVAHGAAAREESEDKCSVFISRKTSDRQVVGEEIRDQLALLAPDRLDFFTAERIEPGQPWAKEIRKELDKADILLLVLTKPARNDFDWCLYEAGLFEDLNGGKPKSIVCLYPEGQSVPDQLSGLQGLEAQVEKIFKYLVSLYTDPTVSKTQTPLNRRLAKPRMAEAQLMPIAKQVYELINEKPDDRVDLIHANKWIQVVLKQGLDSLEPDVPVLSDKASLEDLFNLPRNPPAGRGEHFDWDTIKAKSELANDPDGYNLKWTDELETEVAVRRGDLSGLRASRQLTGRFLGRDGKLYRPEIELYRVNTNGTLTVDVTFSEQVQDSWLTAARPPAALAANIALASRIRHQLLDHYLEKPHGWPLAAEAETEFEELRRAQSKIESEGFFIGMLSSRAMGKAFTGRPTEGQLLYDLGKDFKEEIRPRLKKAIEAHDVKGAREALFAWKNNNERFLQMGLDVYASLLGLDQAAVDCEPPIEASGAQAEVGFERSRQVASTH